MSPHVWHGALAMQRPWPKALRQRAYIRVADIWPKSGRCSSVGDIHASMKPSCTLSKRQHRPLGRRDRNKEALWQIASRIRDCQEVHGDAESPSNGSAALINLNNSTRGRQEAMVDLLVYAHFRAARFRRRCVALDTGL